MILLNRSYAGYAAGTIVQFPTNVETALIAQGIGVTSAGPVTPGAVTTSASQGRVGIAAGSASVVITNASITAESKIYAVLSNASADSTSLYITRVVPAAGSVTIYVNANATAAIAIDWAIINAQGGMVSKM